MQILQIKFSDIAVSAINGAHQVSTAAIKSKENISIDDIKLLRHFPLSSEHGLNIVNTMIVSALCCYHDQLREKLLESGIDIGEIDFSHEELDRFLESQDDTED